MLIAWVVVGIFAGWLAGVLTGSEDYGCAANLIIGMIGSIIGGSLELWLRTGHLGLSLQFTGLSLYSVVVSTIGAVILLGLLHVVRSMTR